MTTPKFLMGGIRLSRNFLGYNTGIAFLQCSFEQGLKALPFIFFFKAFA